MKQNNAWVVAGIVTYNPDIERLKENINAILPQVQGIICIDNNSKNIKAIEKLFEFKDNIILKKNSDNKGMAIALNQIMSIAQKHNIEWVLTLDQDSVCSSEMIENFYPWIRDEKIGIIAPRIVDRNTKNDLKQRKIKKDVEIVPKCITSASLMRVTAWEKTGGFDENMFIDFVDFDYCLSMRKKGYKILKVNTVELLHQIGNTNIKRIFGIPLRVTNHSVFRNYYYARNAIYMLKKHHSIAYPVMLMIRSFKIAIYEKERRKKFRAQIEGICDGVRMKVKNCK